MFDPREWEYTPEPESFSTIVAKDSPKEIESVDPFDLDVSQPTPTPDPDPEEAFSTITHEPDPGRDFNLVEAITAPDEGGEYDYHQTPAGLTVAKLQPSDHLLDEAEAKTFYPHPTPGPPRPRRETPCYSRATGRGPSSYRRIPPTTCSEEAPTALVNAWRRDSPRQRLPSGRKRRPPPPAGRVLAHVAPAWAWFLHGTRRAPRRGAVPRRRRWRSRGGTHRRRGVDAGTLGPARYRPHQTALACGRCAREQLQPRLGGPAGRVHARFTESA